MAAPQRPHSVQERTDQVRVLSPQILPGVAPSAACSDDLSGRVKDKYVTAFEDLASVKLNEDAAICRPICDSDPPSRAPDDEVGFLYLRHDRGLVHFRSPISIQLSH